MNYGFLSSMLNNYTSKIFVIYHFERDFFCLGNSYLAIFGSSWSCLVTLYHNLSVLVLNSRAILQCFVLWFLQNCSLRWITHFKRFNSLRMRNEWSFCLLPCIDFFHGETLLTGSECGK